MLRSLVGSEMCIRDRDRGCQNTCLNITLAYVYRSVLSREHWRMALSKLGKLMLERTRRIGQAWAVLSYYTDQLMMPCSKYFSGGSTLNGAPGWDRWARVLCGQIGWLSEPLHRVDADCSGCTNLKMQTHGKNTEKKSAPPKTHHESHSSPATATTSRRRAKTHVPRPSPYSPASIDTGFVEIGLVQLSQSVKTTNSMSNTRTHMPTDKLNNGTLYAPRYEEAFLPIGKYRPRSLRSLGLASLLVEREMRYGGLILAAGRVRSKKKKIRKNPPHPKHTTKATASRRPRPTRDGARRNTSHALVHTHPLP